MAAEANLNQLRDGVRIEVTQAYEELRGARAAIEAARVGVTAAEESYNVRLRQVDAGAAVANDVIDAESDLTRARLALVDAQIAAKLARDRLSHAVGDDAPAE